MGAKKAGKPIKKLAVKREKVRTLKDESMAKVAGGWNTGWCTTGGGSGSWSSGGYNHNQALLRA